MTLVSYFLNGTRLTSLMTSVVPSSGDKVYHKGKQYMVKRRHFNLDTNNEVHIFLKEYGK